MVEGRFEVERGHPIAAKHQPLYRLRAIRPKVYVHLLSVEDQSVPDFPHFSSFLLHHEDWGQQFAKLAWDSDRNLLIQLLLQCFVEPELLPLVEFVFPWWTESQQQLW
jgi:hypothetical protein